MHGCCDTTARPGRVAVIIATYNRWPHVADAIDSALAQSLPVVDVIVVDDGSTDGTAAHLATRYGTRIRLLALPANGEKSRARNAGLAAATTEFVCLLDSDDVLPPQSVADRLCVFQQDPAFDGVAYGASSGVGYAAAKARACLPSGDILLAYVANFGLLNNNAFLLRRARLLEIGAYCEAMTNMEDRELLIRLAARLPFRSCGTVTQQVRRVDRSARSNYAKIVAQGGALTAALRNDAHTMERLGERFQEVAFSEEREIARALYKLGRYREFIVAARALFADYPGYMQRDWLFRRRLLRAWIGRLFAREQAGAGP